MAQVGKPHVSETMALFSLRLVYLHIGVVDGMAVHCAALRELRPGAPMTNKWVPFYSSRLSVQHAVQSVGDALLTHREQ